MGISIKLAEYLVLQKEKNSVNASNILCLGRQRVIISPFMTRQKWEKHLGPLLRDKCFIQEDGFSECLFRSVFGDDCIIDSLDISDYEGANIASDLNEPINSRLIGKYDLVFDGGTSEHVFNYPQALLNAMQMVKIGGYLLIVNPVNNYVNHGFYQICPSLFATVLSEKNGYSVLDMTVDTNPSFYSHLSRIDKENYQSMICIKEMSNIYVFAKRIGDVPNQLKIQQESYQSRWDNHSDEKSGGEIGLIKKITKKALVVVGLWSISVWIKDETYGIIRRITMRREQRRIILDRYDVRKQITDNRKQVEKN